MRTSTLSRSVIAVASIALGSAALAATPATAATPSGITREQVLAATAGARANTLTDAQNAAARAIAAAGCGLTATDEYLVQPPQATTAGDDADGVVLTANVTSSPARTCTVAAFVTADPSFTLSGTATIKGTTLTIIPPAQLDFKTVETPSALSGDVFVTPAVNTQSYLGAPSASATGNATKTTTATTTTKVITKKTKAQKKAAKKKYEKRLKAAKRSYKKALSKAGKSKAKKAAAKKAYTKRKVTAKASYKKAIAGFKLVRSTTSSTENRPFSITTETAAP